MLLLKPRHQAMIVAAADQRMAQEKRQTFIDRVLGQLRLHQFNATNAVSDGDVDDAITKALVGLIHNSAA